MAHWWLLRQKIYMYNLNILVIFYTVYPLYTFTISSTNNNFNILKYMYNICVKVTTDNTTTAGINYKDCTTVNVIPVH